MITNRFKFVPDEKRLEKADELVDKFLTLI